MFWLKLGWSWLSGGGFAALTGIYNKYKDSAIESERIQADWAKAQLDAMSRNRSETSGYWEMRTITAIIAGVFTLHLVLVGLDTMFHWTWDGLPVNAFPKPFNEYEGSILLSFFGLTAGVIGIKAIANAFKR